MEHQPPPSLAFWVWNMMTESDEWLIDSWFNFWLLQHSLSLLSSGMLIFDLWAPQKSNVPPLWAEWIYVHLWWWGLEGESWWCSSRVSCMSALLMTSMRLTGVQMWITASSSIICNYHRLVQCWLEPLISVSRGNFLLTSSLFMIFFLFHLLNLFFAAI